MRTFNTYQQPSTPTSLARKWFFRALIISLIIHAGLYAAFRATKIKNYNTYTERLVPRNFTVSRVTLHDDPPLPDPNLKKQDEQVGSPPKQQTTIDVPKDTPTADPNAQDVVMTPTGPDSLKPITTDSPKASDSDLKNLTNMQKNVSKDLDTELNKVNDQLLNDQAHTNSKSVVKFSEDSKSGSTGPGNPGGNDSAIPGMKSLDDALSSTGGGLQNGDKIGIRGGALFEYDKSEILPGAMADLKGLADKVKRYPNASLLIEGYADSIGSATDPQYNKDLSQRRAEAVKAFLQTVGIDASRIQAVGNGSTKFIDPPTYDPAKQALEPDNRRVEIVFIVPK